VSLLVGGILLLYGLVSFTHATLLALKLLRCICVADDGRLELCVGLDDFGFFLRPVE
jgi:hypothetical protein